MRYRKRFIAKSIYVIQNYPIVLTYNGDDFDLPYLYAKSQDPSIDPLEKKPIGKELVPILVKKDSFTKGVFRRTPFIGNMAFISIFSGLFKTNLSELCF